MHQSERVIRLRDDEYAGLQTALGYVAACARKDHHRGMFNLSLRLANAVNRGDPNFIPYTVPEESKPERK